MKSLLDERPDRKLVAPAKESPTVMLVHGCLFFRRGKDVRTFIPEPSKRVFDDFLSRHAGVDIVVLVPKERNEVLSSVIKGHEDRIKAFIDDQNNIYSSNKELVALLESLGIRFRPGNAGDVLRQLSLFNIMHFVSSGNVISIGPDDFEKAGVAPDKEDTIQDMILRRQRSSWI